MQQCYPIRWPIALSLQRSFTQLVKQRAYQLFHLGMPEVDTPQVREHSSQQQPLLGLPYVFLRLSLAQPIRDEADEPALLNLEAHLHDEPRGHILQHDRLQCKAARVQPAFDQAAPQQPIKRFQQLLCGLRRHQQGTQLTQVHRLAHNRQPAQHRLLERREAVELLAQ
jgi:hypothetical protein